jgi:hypothetical protein
MAQPANRFITHADLTIKDVAVVRQLPVLIHGTSDHDPWDDDGKFNGSYALIGDPTSKTYEAINDSVKIWLKKENLHGTYVPDCHAQFHGFYSDELEMYRDNRVVIHPKSSICTLDELKANERVMYAVPLFRVDTPTDRKSSRTRLAKVIASRTGLSWSVSRLVVEIAAAPDVVFFDREFYRPYNKWHRFEQMRVDY